MLPAVSSILENVLKSQHLFAPLLLVILSALANAHGPAQHSLLITCVSWASIWVPTLFRAGLWSNNASKQRSTSWLAGGFLALAQVCERAACDKEGIWSTKGLLPLFAALIPENEALSKHLALPIYTHLEDPTADNSGGVEKRPHQRSYRLLITATASASIVLATRYTTFQTFALGVCSTIFAASGLVLFEAALTGSKDNNEDYTQDAPSTDRNSSRQISWATSKDQHMAALRDVAFVMALVCGIATPLVEPLITSDAVSWAPVYDALRGDWKSHSYQRIVQQILTMISVNIFVNVFTFVMIAQEGAVHTTLLVLFSCICARLNLAMSLSGIWFAGIFGLSAVLLSTSSTSTSLLDVRGSMRIRRIFPWFATLSIGLSVFRYASTPGHYLFTHNDSSTLTVSQPDSPFTPIPMDLTKGHPAAQLMGSAEREFDDLLKRQSKSLGEAVQEYRRRNGIAPPPHFDKWYEYATRNGVVLIDEFDIISQSLLPFWALKPATIRARIKNALGFETSETALLAVAIRNGDVVNIEGGHEWQQKATAGMVKGFVQYLPDMDIGFNTHDEPRVVVPINLLSDMLVKAQEEVLPRTAKLQSPRDSFSPRPSDLNDGKNFEEASTSRFNRFTHQQTWTNSRLSCPTNSQAQTFEDYAADNMTAYSAGPLNYIYNRTAFSDICNSPSYSKKFGFFERPNAFSITHELTPIFSQSKISTFQDILYPSPWYWFGKVEYDSDHDTAWENKTNSLYWRGSTTGGFSRNGGWRRQHRQRIVRQINAPNKAKLLVAAGDGENPKYEVQEVQRKDFKHLINVKFSHVGQCDPGDCDAQKEFFEVTERVDRQDAFYHKHILDMDGNAFSGRFYSFLKSKSLTYKMAIFREWHEEWLKPWVHYIPISLIGDEHLDLVRWFGGNAPPLTEKEAKKFDNKGGNGDSLGEQKAREIAKRSTEWHDKVLRKVDMEAWFFRLLLEYGRIIDDNREEIGYPGP